MNNKKYLIFGGISLLLIGAILITVFIIFNNKEKEEPKVDDHVHTDYEAGTDPFIKDEGHEFEEQETTLKEGKVSIIGIDYTTPKKIDNVTNKSDMPTIKAGTKNFLYFINNDNSLYYYNIATGSKKVIGKSVKNVFPSENEDYVFFVKESNSNSEGVFAYDLKSNRSLGQIFVGNYNNVTENVSYHEGILYITYKSLNDFSNPGAMTEMKLWKNKNTANILPKNDYVNYSTSPAATISGSELYTYSYDSNSISYLQPFNNKLLNRLPLNYNLDPSETPIKLQINKNKDNFALVTTKEGNTNSYVYSKEGSISKSSLDEVIKAYWLDNDMLLIQNRSTIYINSFAKNELATFKKLINDVIVVDNKIYFVDVDYNLYEVEKLK